MTVSFKQLRAAEFASVMPLREAIKLQDAVSADLERDRDLAGIVGAFIQNDVLIGTIRLVPLGKGLAPCDAVLGAQVANYPNACEIGRLVLAADKRDTPGLLGSCLLATFEHVIANTHYQHGFALCAPKLARLYQRFGATVMASNVVGEFTLIHSSIATIRSAFLKSSTPGNGQALM